MKKIYKYVFILTFIIGIYTSTYVYANIKVGQDVNLDIKINLDNHILMEHNASEPTEVLGFIYYDRTYMPLRTVMESMGATVSWNDYDKSFTTSCGGYEVIMSIDSNIAIVDGQNYEMDVAPMLVNNNVYIPVRYMAQFFNNKVYYDDNQRTVYINAEFYDNVDAFKYLTALQANNLVRDISNYMPFESIEYPKATYRNYEITQQFKKIAKDKYNIQNNEYALKTLLDMYTYGSNNEFLTNVEIVKKKPEALRNDFDYFVLEIDEYYGQIGIIAYDLTEVISVAGICYNAGYISLWDYYNLSIPAAIILQNNFSDFLDVDRNYIYGYAYNSNCTIYDPNDELKKVIDAHEIIELTPTIETIDFNLQLVQ